MFSWSVIDEYVGNGLLTKRKHPKFSYWIVNYTAQVQFKRQWDEVTLACRGLILDDDGNIIARPFPKFFNYEELMNTELGKMFPIPNLSYNIYSKLDGSLGIMYQGPDKEYYIASRGSFDSEQAKVGTGLLRTIWEDIEHLIEPRYTYLFEIIYPGNRIVVDYMNETKLIFLAAIEKSTGLDHTLAFRPEWRRAKAQRYTDFTYDNIRNEISSKNKEGFVVVFDNGFRMKMKYNEYIKLHRVISSMNNDKYIWECLKDGVDIEDMIKDIPDEFYQEVKEKILNFQTKYNLVKDYYDYFYETAKNSLDDAPRKNYASVFKMTTHPGILFAMLDGKDIDQLIWKAIKPNDSK